MSIFILLMLFIDANQVIRLIPSIMIDIKCFGFLKPKKLFEYLLTMATCTQLLFAFEMNQYFRGYYYLLLRKVCLKTFRQRWKNPPTEQKTSPVAEKQNVRSYDETINLLFGIQDSSVRISFIWKKIK